MDAEERAEAGPLEKAQAARGQAGKGAPVVDLPKSASNDAVSALINLGYGRSEAFSAVANVMRELGDHLPLGDIIRESLKELSA